MLPFLQQAVTARKLLVYSGGGSGPRATRPRSPTRPQDPGWRPHHGLRWDAYAGEALVETVKAGDKTPDQLRHRPGHGASDGHGFEPPISSTEIHV